MSAHSHDGKSWVGRSIRRVEDPALVAGLGRFTGDLPAQRWVRFVRSPVASGKIKSVTAPKGAMVLTMAELSGVKPIRPMLHKFNYIPIEHPILADGVVRFVGEPVAAVVASSEEEAEDIVDLVEVEIEETAPLVDAQSGDRARRAAVHAMAPANVIVEGRVKTAGFDATWAARRTSSASRSARAARTRCRSSRAARMRLTISPPAASRSPARPRCRI